MITLQIIILLLLIFLIVLTLLPQKRTKIQTKIEKAFRKPAKVVAPRSNEQIAKYEIAKDREEEDLPEYIRHEL